MILARQEEDKDDSQSSCTKLHSAQGRLILARPPLALLLILCTQAVLFPFVKALTLWPFMLWKGYIPALTHFESTVVDTFKGSREVSFEAQYSSPEENCDLTQDFMHPNLD